MAATASRSGHGGWDLFTCARRGHVTYRPDEADLGARLRGTSSCAELWRCLRCGDFVMGPPQSGGPADQAPLVLRGAALRQAFIIRLLAVERLLRAVLIGLAVWAVLAFRSSQETIQAAIDRVLPALRGAGLSVDQFALVQDLERAVQ